MRTNEIVLLYMRTNEFVLFYMRTNDVCVLVAGVLSEENHHSPVSSIQPIYSSTDTTGGPDAKAQAAEGKWTVIKVYYNFTHVYLINNVV